MNDHDHNSPEDAEILAQAKIAKKQLGELVDLTTRIHSKLLKEGVSHHAFIEAFVWFCVTGLVHISKAAKPEEQQAIDDSMVEAVIKGLMMAQEGRNRPEVSQ